jgi:EthD domain
MSIGMRAARNAVDSTLNPTGNDMFKLLAFLTKRDGMETQDFIDYYENKHVPLICSLAPAPIIYKRRYLMPGEKLTNEGGVVDFDVVTEQGFTDRAAFLAWMFQLAGPGVGEQVAADEARFLDRSRTRAYVVEEHVTSG